jgi:hypothetical protein
MPVTTTEVPGSTAFREDNITTGAALYFLVNELLVYALRNTGHRNGFRLFTEGGNDGTYLSRKDAP